MNNCSKLNYEESVIVSSGLETEEEIIVSVYSESLPSMQKENHKAKELLEFDDVDTVCDLKLGNNATKTLDSIPVTVEISTDLGLGLNEKLLTRTKETSVFESVRAIVNKEVYHILNLQNECDIINTMKEHMKEAVQFYELEYDQLVIVGCLNDLLYCQRYLTSCLQKKNNELKSYKCCKSKFEPPLQETAEILIYSDDHYEAETFQFNKEPENFTLANMNGDIKCSYELTFGEKCNQVVRSYKKNSCIQTASTDDQKDWVSGPFLSIAPLNHKQEFYQFSCSICSFKCTRRNHLLKHKNQHQKSTTLHYCDLCDFKTIRLSQLGKHKKLHNQENFVVTVDNDVQKRCRGIFLECNEHDGRSDVNNLNKISKPYGKELSQRLVRLELLTESLFTQESNR